MQFVKLETVDSTNIYAKSHIEDLCDKTVVHAIRQTNGRGRLNRSWIDFGEGNLFFSIILKPSENFNNIYANLTQYASVVICNILDEYGINPQIKWPNDVMIDGMRKISGILCETVMQSGKLKAIILGIGINLCASKSDVNNVTDRVVTALNLEIGKIIKPNEFLNKFLTEFWLNYDNFLENGFEFIKNDYIKRNCFLNKDLKVQVLNETKSGFASNITDGGALILTKDDKELVLTIGDIL